MAQAALTQFLRSVGDACNRQDGHMLQIALAMKNLPAKRIDDITSAGGNPATAAAVSREASSLISKPFDSMTVSLLQSHHARSNKRHTAAYQFAVAATDVLFTLLCNDKESNWWLSAIDVCGVQLRSSASAVDAEELLSNSSSSSAATGDSASKTSIEAANNLTRFFRSMINDRAPIAVSKKMGLLFVIVQLFKIYFKINNLRLCNNLINSVENKNFPSLDLFPKCQTVAYKYYLGRLMVFDEKYDEAEVALSTAFKHCLRSHTRNKHRVLQFLIPVKLLLGKFPDERLLIKHKLLPFVNLSRAIRTGSIKQFNESLEEYQEYFIRKGIFLILEKLKILVYRNLIRKVHAFNAQYQPDKPNLLKLATLQTALRLNGEDMSLDELECILANLIYKSYMKGYISHKKLVVMSKLDPFPRISA